MNRYKLIHTLPNGKEIYLGAVYYSEPRGGWIFNPFMPHRQSSRKAHPNPTAAVPQWARKQVDRVEVRQ